MSVDDMLAALSEAQIDVEANSLVMRMLLRALIDTHPDKGALLRAFQSYMQDLDGMVPTKGADRLQASIDGAYNSFAEAMKRSPR